MRAVENVLKLAGSKGVKEEAPVWRENRWRSFQLFPVVTLSEKPRLDEKRAEQAAKKKQAIFMAMAKGSATELASGRVISTWR